jgi:hypothetical protein
MSDNKLKPYIDYTSKDYEAFRNDMLNLIPHLMPEYTDFSESDAGVMMIELSAYVADILSYYNDRVANEVYLPTATQRKSIIDVSKQLGYKLKNAKPSATELVIELSGSTGQDFIIPKGFAVSTIETDYEDAIVFETTEDLIIPAGALGTEVDQEGNYLYSVPAVQGMTIPNEVVGSSNGQPLQRFKLKYNEVIDGSLEVLINEGNGFDMWTDTTNSSIGIVESGKQYTTETDEDGFTWIVFGDGLNGKIPANGSDNIISTYRIGGGLHTNVGSNTLTETLTSIAGINRVFNPIPATGGTDEEKLDEAKRNAPKLFKTQDRAVTKEDYQNIAISVPGVAKAVAIPDKVSNTVHVTIAPDGGGIPSDTIINNTFSVLDAKKIITTAVEVEVPKYVYAKLDLELRINEEYSQSGIRAYIIETIKSIFDFTQRNFGEGVPISLLYYRLMGIQGVYSVSVNKCTISPIIEWTNVSGNPTFTPITILPTNTYKGTWIVEMTNTTTFEVFKTSYNAEGEETRVSKGTGTFGTEFTDSDNSIKFTITQGTVNCNIGDSWTFDTLPYLSDIEVNENEILLLDEPELLLVLTGGRP